MEKKLIFFDLDGTLLNSEKKITKEVAEALQKAREKGHTLAIATGRAPFMIQEIIEETGIQSLVTFNGQYVLHEGNVVHSHPIDEELLHQLEKFSTEQNVPLVHLDGKDMRANIKDETLISDVLQAIRMDFPGHEDQFFVGKSIYQTLMFGEFDVSALRDTFKQLHFIRWHEKSCDVLPLGGSKASGIEQLAKHLGFSQADTVAFGDGLNDFEMMDWVGVSVAMDNAHEELKKRATHATKSCDEHGVAHGLKMLQLIE
ncbi:MAG: Cof-type HAD-IIB family hydrolase [Bacilli bacterium]